jgi:DNA-binding response OmpR family regulator
LRHLERVRASTLFLFLVWTEGFMAFDASRKQIVLVVEDDPMLRGILTQALADEGHAVIATGSGEEALAIAGPLHAQLGLVVVDVMLPMMDGLELADRLAVLSAPPPVLFISGLSVKRTLPGPMLVKPFGPTAFLEQVGRMLAGVGNPR